jgi:hypothetical protein
MQKILSLSHKLDLKRLRVHCLLLRNNYTAAEHLTLNAEPKLDLDRSYVAG